jgi:hypothetical protein
MFDHTLDACKGWFHEAALDHSALLSSNVTIDPLEQGRVVHLRGTADADQGKYQTGCVGSAMAIFLLNSSNDPDVANPGGDYWTAVAPTGKMSGLVATGAYELESSEYLVTGTDYIPGQYLASQALDTDATVGGTLSNEDDAGVTSADITAGTALTHPYSGAGTDQAIVGVVSSGVNENSHGVSVLRFWPVYCPGES